MVCRAKGLHGNWKESVCWTDVGTFLAFPGSSEFGHLSTSTGCSSDIRVCQGAHKCDVPSGVGKREPALAGKEKVGMVHSVGRWTQGVEVKLWDPLRMCVMAEHLRNVFMTRRYTNPCLPDYCWREMHKKCTVQYNDV